MITFILNNNLMNKKYNNYYSRLNKVSSKYINELFDGKNI